MFRTPDSLSIVYRETHIYIYIYNRLTKVLQRDFGTLCYSCGYKSLTKICFRIFFFFFKVGVVIHR